MGKNLVWAGLAFGTVSYCLVLLVAQDAPVFTLALMGTLALFLVASSLWVLWNRNECETTANPTEPVNAAPTESED